MNSQYLAPGFKVVKERKKKGEGTASKKRPFWKKALIGLALGGGLAYGGYKYHQHYPHHFTLIKTKVLSLPSKFDQGVNYLIQHGPGHVADFTQYKQDVIQPAIVEKMHMIRGIHPHGPNMDLQVDNHIRKHSI